MMYRSKPLAAPRLEAEAPLPLYTMDLNDGFDATYPRNKGKITNELRRVLAAACCLIIVFYVSLQPHHQDYGLRLIYCAAVLYRHRCRTRAWRQPGKPELLESD